MIKIVACLVVMCGFSAGYSIPAQNAFMYYQQPMSYRTVQRTMYGSHFRNEQFRNQRVSDLAPGVHPNDCQHIDSAELPVQDANVGSVADAYPSEQFPVEEDVPAVYEDESEEPLADEVSVPAPLPEKKNKGVPTKVYSSEEEEEDTDEEIGSNDTAAPNTFFPINFGSANGGAIAIANSYSTGKGGSATSTSTAYGTPATSELRRKAVLQLRRRPAKFRGRQ
ncbi:AAEL001263-PA [Aedes aegypti]|uniref:AAEL001263-PA n=1 Tax=Aedes aegypti TaxID=7159 RepID=Q17LQ4_AEDAE|nr:AAEL001263-PA [Aedes aegypti]